MDLNTLAGNIEASIEKIANSEIGGIKIEAACHELLDVGDEQTTFDQHVRIQPAAMAFFGALKKEAHRSLMRVKRDYERWTCKKWSECKASVIAGTGSAKELRVKDVESRMAVDNEQEMKNWESMIDEKQKQYDIFDCWFEAWKSKGFSIKEFSSIDNEERFTTDSITEKNVPKKFFDRSGPDRGSIGRVREILRKRREGV